ncbi:MAG: molybdopterin-dependent oxidoreductase [Bilophila wadsworthia]
MRHNILSSLPDPDTLRSKLDKLDLIVAITTTWSPTADYADIVLPLSPALSRESILASKLGLKPQFFRRQRAVQPRFDTRADWGDPVRPRLRASA